MSKWKWKIIEYDDGSVSIIEDNRIPVISVIAANLYRHYAEQIVREHNAHAEIVLCIKAMLKITCGECRGERPGKCAADQLACALSAQARAAIEAAEGRPEDEV